MWPKLLLSCIELSLFEISQDICDFFGDIEQQKTSKYSCVIAKEENNLSTIEMRFQKDFGLIFLLCEDKKQDRVSGNLRIFFSLFYSSTHKIEGT